MGLGKSIQTICIVGSTTIEQRNTSAASPSLIVAPTTLVNHWSSEFEKFCGDQISVATHAGGGRAKVLPLGGGVEVVVTSYEALRADVALFQSVSWGWMVLDEGHMIRNHQSKMAQSVKTVRAAHRLVLSGTPIQNSVGELWSLFDFLMPGFLGTRQQFNKACLRVLEVARKPKATADQQAASEAALAKLHRKVLPFLLRRLKSEVLKELPAKTIQDLYVDPSAIQLELYQHFNQAQLTHGAKHVFAGLQYLRKLCNHPALVLSPDHPLHSAITARVSGSGIGIEHAPKLAALRQLIVACCSGGEGGEGEAEPVEIGVGGSRMLVFAQQKGFLDLIERQLLNEEMSWVTWLRLDGGVPAHKRVGVVDRFNQDPTIQLLLLTTHVGGLGLNLTGASTVVFMDHDWNPQKDLQAMDRAHRLGQTRAVNVYRLITLGTLEEKIMNLQSFKLHVANTVVDQQNSSVLSMGRNDLLELMKFSKTEHLKKTLGHSSAPVSTALVPGAMAEVREGPSVYGKSVENKELWGEEEYEEYDLSTFIAQHMNST
eukprot:TRINITY_DN8440_c0_g1_i3.p1 TRINITY_DN8440_c0_g1~~TRINITY_DN8440_c0_g1_i3.p1  ORF type:complete len:543 (+),score=125.54 TRINITY_DN8440_c0_g1_i3:3-1631(+)